MLGRRTQVFFYTAEWVIPSLLTLLIVPRCHLWQVPVVITFHFQIEDLAFWLCGIDNKVFIQEFLRKKTSLFFFPSHKNNVCTRAFVTITTNCWSINSALCTLTCESLSTVVTNQKNRKPNLLVPNCGTSDKWLYWAALNSLLQDLMATRA